MSYAPHRSAIELDQGMVDGTYKLVAPDRGGDVDPATYRARADLSDAWFGVHEAPVKELPDGIGPVVTPTTVSTPPAPIPYV